MAVRAFLLLLLVGWALEAATGTLGVPEVLGAATAFSPAFVPAAVGRPACAALQFYKAWKAHRARRRLLQQLAGRRRARARFLAGHTAEDIMSMHSEAEMVRCFGLDKETIAMLADVIKEEVEGRAAMRRGSQDRHGVRSSALLQLLVTLRWLRGGSHHDIRMLSGISTPMLYVTFYRVMHAINKHFSLPLTACVDSALRGDYAPLEAFARGFAFYTAGVISTIFGAIDGVQARPARAPSPCACAPP